MDECLNLWWADSQPQGFERAEVVLPPLPYSEPNFSEAVELKRNRFVRALSPPAASGVFTVFRDEKLVILSTELYPSEPNQVPGHVVYRLEDRGILVKTGDGVLLVKDVEYPGSRFALLICSPGRGSV